MAPVKYVGADYVTPDLVAKVMGQAKYAEDFRAEGMLFCKLLLSPLPHARVRRIDATAALALPGVKAILTPDDLPAPNNPLPPGAERPLTNEPHYQGEPVVAVAAVDELVAANAVEKIRIDWEPLPFVVDPLESLRPGGANARTAGNVWYPSPPGQTPPRPEIKTLKWTVQDFVDEVEGRLPMGEVPEEWSFGDLAAAFKDAALVLDETFVVQSTSHQPMEPRSAMAYWQNGKLFLHASTQSVIRTVDNVANWLSIKPSELVLISQYCGGGFGSKGGGPISMSIPALLSKKSNAPVMMRVSREEEHFIGRARTNMTGRAKVAFMKMAAWPDSTSSSSRTTALTDHSAIFDRPETRFRCCINRWRCGGVE
jgi:CO/xanthine dehydrogenase Mo-binding subunit